MAPAGAGPSLKSSKGTLPHSPWGSLKLSRGPWETGPTPGEPGAGIDATTFSWGGLPPPCADLQTLVGAWEYGLGPQEGIDVQELAIF